MSTAGVVLQASPYTPPPSSTPGETRANLFHKRPIDCCELENRCVVRWTHDVRSGLPATQQRQIVGEQTLLVQCLNDPTVGRLPNSREQPNKNQFPPLLVPDGRNGEETLMMTR